MLFHGYFRSDPARSPGTSFCGASGPARGTLESAQRAYSRSRVPGLGRPPPAEAALMTARSTCSLRSCRPPTVRKLQNGQSCLPRSHPEALFQRALVEPAPVPLGGRMQLRRMPPPGAASHRLYASGSKSLPGEEMVNVGPRRPPQPHRRTRGQRLPGSQTSEAAGTQPRARVAGRPGSCRGKATHTALAIRRRNTCEHRHA